MELPVPGEQAMQPPPPPTPPPSPPAQGVPPQYGGGSSSSAGGPVYGGQAMQPPASHQPPPPPSAAWRPRRAAGHWLAEGCYVSAFPQPLAVPPHPGANRMVSMEVDRAADLQRIIVTAPALSATQDVLIAACFQLGEDPNMHS
eukprot:13873307-Alexandrium_andersonii.AAC.1